MVTGELVRGNYVGTRGDEGAGEGKAERERASPWEAPLPHHLTGASL